MAKTVLHPNYIFEVSWEVCNKVGGINTVVATKALNLVTEYKEHYITIGPDLWRDRNNPSFTEDKNLYRNFKNRIAEEGISIRVGHWEIPGKPIAILVDYTPFLNQRDKIFTTFWEAYKLDSISGGMEYVECATFGYVVGKVVENFIRHNLSFRDKVLAHFHEWQTGSGVLYLNKFVPQVATVFTTHATVVGRSLASNGYSLYDKLKEYNGDGKAHELGVVAKHSMEKCAAHAADCFSTVSEITASECEQFLEKRPDVITPNGFEDNFVPKGKDFSAKREAARKKLREVAEAMLGEKLPNDVIFVANSGRYEFKNKGIDIFINSIGELNVQEKLNKTVVAFILVPAHTYGPRKDLTEKLAGNDTIVSNEGNYKYLTHGLHDSDYDAILNEIKAVGLENKKEDKTKIFFAPCYLDGNDGIFNLEYYDILIGLDVTIFPSYYEPWGYTPLESIAFHVPTITTACAGMGMWVNTEIINAGEGIDVFERVAGKDGHLITKISDRLLKLAEHSEYEMEKIRENAYTISRVALWKNLLKHYKTGFGSALQKVEDRSEMFVEMTPIEQQVIPSHKIQHTNRPNWNELTIHSHVPAKFKGLEEMANNIWSSWNHAALDLFESIDPELWDKVGRFPTRLLKELTYEKIKELEDDEQFNFDYNTVYKSYKKYWSDREKPKGPKIAYFSMEYGLNSNVKIYSGGLGLLAGDYLKEASDCNVNIVAIGFLYKYGYFTQQISIKGEQLVNYEPQDFSNLPLHPVVDAEGETIIIQVAFPGRAVYARLWRIDVGVIPLYLIDTDIDRNSHEDRSISHQLYGGNNEHRLKQEMFLGIGGIRALDAIGIRPDLYHCNEGHAAFIGLERLRKLINNRNFTFAESQEIVRASTLFTTHTPVPAGHDAFPEDLMMMYMGHYPQRLRISWDQFMNLGRWHPENHDEKFSMSILAVNLSQEVNGVSMLHGEVTRYMFDNMWKGYYPSELHIGYVTNGVHMPTWVSKEWMNLYKKEFGKGWIDDQSNHDHWGNINKVSDKVIWELRQSHRKRLLDYIKGNLGANWSRRQIDPKTLVHIKNTLNDNVLTIGFARRFATYKRAYLLFKDLDRLSKIVNNPLMPVQFLFAGKAHPADGGGQKMIKEIVEISYRPEFKGKIVFVENYDIDLAKKMVQGVDVWLNNPTRPLEASGTSGMKAIMNGVLNFSVLDGWWVEGYKEGAGWALPQESAYPNNNEFQDDLDAELIYSTLETEMVPMFYKRDMAGIPLEWIRYIKNCIADINPEFTTKRMIDDYMHRYYSKLYHRTLEMRKDDFAMAKQISSWKKKVALGWDSIEVVEVDFLNKQQKENMELGKKYSGHVILDLKELPIDAVGVELVMAEKNNENQINILKIVDLETVETTKTKVKFSVEMTPVKAGNSFFGFRIYPKHKDLPHRMDFGYVRWI